MSVYTTFEFYEGADYEMVIDLRTYDREREGRVPVEIETGDIITVTLPTENGDNIVADAQVTRVKNCWGRIKIDISKTLTATLSDGTVIVDLERGGKTRRFIAMGAIQKKNLGNC